MTQFRGTFSVMVTAYDDAGNFDAARMARYTDWQVTEGIHGLIPLGSTGEFLSLSTKERESVARCVVDTTAGRVPVLIGAGAESTEEVIENCRMAEAVGADGVMIIPPFYSTPTEDELFRHYARISEATSLPIMLYNNPATANVDLTPPIVARLSVLDRVDYIKESTMDVTRVRDILDLCGDRMTVFGGIMGFESFVNGAEGWVAVGSNILPRDCARLFSLTADAQDYDAAREIYRKILPVIRLVGGHRYVSATKKALELMGLPTGAPRSPRLPLPEAEMPELLAALKAVDLLEHAEA
ncbi:dihydrodipicolinate synthase family protein [Mameliella sediminis]|uniref:dihydrodipicolinate synthase family protein n=1 Tax=Mameliella sediminis TaxID=2836866 RepID=UPI001C47B979|nr:dihydrodipicolinate synthase family protein [Mameliella sediminis]MBY6116782.1 dihydrodipicolinate synthase family protein [Antarctobacter heliothermus]MBY6146535.1 dihydrodipicolinate synthase family protein [Mameliella alba]MBV7396437.1 dihydrodipicolinate synthase family protein [Mameliella sediminis]MBY6162764.1 dihydrodipicolinate synthase family protein [Mameliella alba]MBY6171027.1 dihydrodipicolinate synthase family protein [Mameliella alba]